MKKYIVICLLIVFTITTIAFASTDSPNVRVSLLKYSPYPAEPGKYLTLTFKVENTGNADAENVKLKLPAEYPFSFDSNSTVKKDNSATPIPIDSSMVVALGRIPASEYMLVEYKVRVASDALEDNSQIKIWQQTKAGEAWTIQTFTVLVQGTDRLEVSNVIPYTLTPGKPTDVVFVLNNSGTSFVRNVVFTWSEKDNNILPLGTGNRKYVESIEPGHAAEIPFTLVANPSASSGVYTLSTNITYIIGANINKSQSVNVGMFIGGDAEFDVSLSDSSSGSVSFSIANVGSNPTTSVSVKIPQQPGYSVSGASTSFLGNLDPGDFTIATFQITSISRNFTMPQNRPDQMPTNASQTPRSSQGTLKVEITYTDTNSNRQTVTKEVDITQQSSVLSTQTQSMQNGQFGRQSNSGLNLIIYGVAGIVIVVLAFRYRKKIVSAVRKIRHK